MAAPATLRTPPRKVWTVADLHRKFGPIPFERIRQDPPPGCGTVDDVVRLNDHEDRLYELVDGILVEKTVGLEESFIAGKILTLLNNFVDPHGLGLVAGEGGTIQLDIDLVRIPDVSFISWDRLPGGEFPDEPVPLLVPDLAVEVISQSNTRKEMDDKLQEYFEKGVRLVWYRAAPAPGGRRLHDAGPLHPADGLDAARWRRRAAGLLGPGRRALRDAEAAGRPRTGRRRTVRGRGRRMAAARSLKVVAHSC